MNALCIQQDFNIHIIYQHSCTSVCRWSGVPSKKKRVVVDDYNNNMIGVDRLDQMMSYYSFKRKSVKWWQKVFFWVLEVMFVNAYILYTKNTSSPRKLTSREFRREIVVSLCSDMPARHVSTRHRHDMTLERLQGQHFPEKVTKRRDCRICSKRGPDEERHLTNIVYGVCSDHPPLCIQGCF